ncbi:MAG: 2-hydroxyacyl-CoA dehydratase [Bacteriovoracaceae bacterium]|jgi:benzoyl-CoA reductase/2-hydroxyglutaryl-CoA dehydratase subunit BcrC/BadD/HgdB|nr:2-hydroxyacyl-CoA dehydratase [Bacteriovoracaceae bacterium]
MSMKIESTKILKKMTTEYFQSFFPKEGKRPLTAWCSSIGPSEILTAMGFQVYYPENHGALLGATRTSNDHIPKAHSIGYHPDICSYLSSDIGAYLNGQTPLTKTYGIPEIPKPDLLVYSTNQCREVQDWFGFYEKEFGAKMIGISSPWKLGVMGSEEVTYVKNQLKEMIKTIEDHFKLKLDPQKLKEVVGLSAESSKLWKTFLRKAKSTPAPFSFFDGCIQMAPAVVLRGRADAVEYYKTLNGEVDQYLATNPPSTKPEFRLYWDGMPIWGKLRFFSDLFKENNTTVVGSTYCDSWIFDCLDGDNPLESMAMAYTRIFINRSEEIKEATLKNMYEEYDCDGMIFHDSKTCPYNSNNRFCLPQRLSDKFNIPNLVIDGDLNDLRCFSEEQTVTAVESFLEQLRIDKL